MAEIQAAQVLDAFRAELKSIVPELDADSIALEDDIADFGIDSLHTLLLISRMEERLDIALPDYELAGVRTVRDLVEAVRRITPEAA